MTGEWRRLLAAGATVFALATVAAAQPTTNESKLPPKDEDPAWLQQIKQPAQWITLGADARIRNEYLNNQYTLSTEAPNHEADWVRLRERIWASVKPTDLKDKFEFYVRLAAEPRYIFEPTPARGWPEADIIVDNLYVKFTKPFDLPLTVTLGRQDIIFREGWLILEGTPLDGSRTIFFDAARFTLDLAQQKTTVDLIYTQMDAESDHFIPCVYNVDAFLREQDERGAILYVQNSSIERTQLDGYFIYKHDDAVLPNGDSGDIYTLGGRAAHDFDKNWKARVEGAFQFGDINGARLQAWGLNSRVAYAFNDTNNNQLRLSYEYLSGDDPGTGANEAFYPVWARWPQWSELLVYTYATESRIAQVTNLQRLAFGWSADPSPTIGLSAEYSLLFANENTLKGHPGYSSDDLFRGQLIQAVLRYKINKHVSGNLWGEVFFPGNYFDNGRNDAATYLRAEVVFTL